MVAAHHGGLVEENATQEMSNGGAKRNMTSILYCCTVLYDKHGLAIDRQTNFYEWKQNAFLRFVQGKSVSQFVCPSDRQRVETTVKLKADSNWIWSYIF